MFIIGSEQLLIDNSSMYPKMEPAQLHLVRPAVSHIMLIAPERLFHISSICEIRAGWSRQ